MRPDSIQVVVVGTEPKYLAQTECAKPPAQLSTVQKGFRAPECTRECGCLRALYMTAVNVEELASEPRDIWPGLVTTCVVVAGGVCALGHQ